MEEMGPVLCVHGENVGLGKWDNDRFLSDIKGLAVGRSSFLYIIHTCYGGSESHDI